MKVRILLLLVFVLFLPPAVAAQPKDADPALYAVGALGASNLYNSYFLLGTLADGYATGAYTAQFADELARDIIGLSESAVEVLEELSDMEAITGGDRRLVSRMIRAHELLIQQSWGLITYVEDTSQTEAWFYYRRLTWEAITEILELE